MIFEICIWCIRETWSNIWRIDVWEEGRMNYICINKNIEVIYCCKKLWYGISNGFEWKLENKIVYNAKICVMERQWRFEGYIIINRKVWRV